VVVLVIVLAGSGREGGQSQEGKTPPEELPARVMMNVAHSVSPCRKLSRG